ncbi:hypothetical protein K491DRAFT_766639 [Lophiostoma macrostomum CBS 122681]|uniref:Uncharacterized protein n=1 Tax=Lophiostoma macrostomum CBS 122681 TaxID=1314788 RepID=A0A6A6TES5_9PLEO|nr:hypothetical protein K491DRAFT_766639 [Lophiostoma macrostomum CBS 122681]
MSECGPRPSIPDKDVRPADHEATRPSQDSTAYTQEAVEERRETDPSLIRQDSLRPHGDGGTKKDEENDKPLLSPSAVEFDTRLKSLSQEDLTQRVVENWDADWSARGSPPSSLGYREEEVVPPSNASHRVSCNPQGRRDNPKIARVRSPRPGFSMEPDPKPDPKPVWDVQQERASTVYEQRVKSADGKPLYRLSDTVPYILGPREYVDGIMALNNFSIPPIVPQDDQGNDVFHKELVTRKDKALLVILMFAGQPASERTSIVQHCLAPFTLSTTSALQCWKDHGAEAPATLDISFKVFAILIRDWQDSAPFFATPIPDPDKRAATISKWSTALTLLRSHNIGIEKITPSLFTELTSLDSETAIEAKITELQKPTHIRRGHRQGHRPPPSSYRGTVSSTFGGPTPAPSAYRVPAYTRGTFDYVTEPSKDARLPYAHRFSHGSPKGELHYSEQTKAFDSYYDGPHATNPARMSVRQMLSERKTQFNQSPFAKACKWLFMALVGAGVVGAILVICIFKVMGRKKGFVEQ